MPNFYYNILLIVTNGTDVVLKLPDYVLNSLRQLAQHVWKISKAFSEIRFQSASSP
jgi:hypothetical protein